VREVYEPYGIDDVLAGLYSCGVIRSEECEMCPYRDIEDCRETLMIDAYENVKKMRQRVLAMEQNDENMRNLLKRTLQKRQN